MCSPEVSVLLPAHGSAPFLREAVTSVLSDCEAVLELIVVNDRLDAVGVETLSEFSDARLRVVMSEASGLVPALNTGLEMCRGTFVARMDADDVSLPRRFTLQSKFLHRNPNVVAVGGQAVLIDSLGRDLGRRRYPTDPRAVARMLKHRNPMAHPATMFRRDAVLAVGGYRNEFLGAEDYDLWLRLVTYGFLANLDCDVLQYRVHAGQITASATSLVAESTFLAQWSARARRQGRADLPLPWRSGQAQVPSSVFWRLVRWRVRAAAREFSSMRAGLMHGQSTRGLVAGVAWTALRPRYALTQFINGRMWLRTTFRARSPEN